MNDAATTIVDLTFPLRGRSLADDHGYALYGALSKAIPELHDADWLAVHPIRGPRRVDGQLGVGRGSRLTLRLPASQIATVLPLACQRLEVAGSELWLGSPTVEALQAATSVDAKLVVVKVTRPAIKADGHIDKVALKTRARDELGRQLAKLHIEASIELLGRRELSVAGRRVLGHSVRVSGLSAAASLMLQRCGLGGKRRMGCGVFVPTRGS